MTGPAHEADLAEAAGWSGCTQRTAAGRGLARRAVPSCLITTQTADHSAGAKPGHPRGTRTNNLDQPDTCAGQEHPHLPLRARLARVCDLCSGCCLCRPWFHAELVALRI